VQTRRMGYRVGGLESGADGLQQEEELGGHEPER